jgi:hypothetical protein
MSSLSFASRTGGKRGANVANLRGTQGATFEGSGKIYRGSPGLFGCCVGSRESQKERYLLIKGPFCFVFVTKDAPSPKYAIGLQSLRALLKSNSSNGGWATVQLTSHVGDVEYECSFPNTDIAKEFLTAVETETSSVHVEAVRKRLGHEHLVTKRTSLIFAETVALEKVQDQPSAPLSPNELISAMPQVGM